ncbi:MAG: hypothetical protein LIP01_08010 [Tannerellaceae bacterium]|nr:hypothetical protein [Tannerellaceae bacterium]
MTTFPTLYPGSIQPHPDEIDAVRFWSINEIMENLGKDVFTPNFENEFREVILPAISGKEYGG